MKGLFTWLISAPMLALIGLYKYVLSPLTPPSCRHYPTCSTYAGEAIREWGPWTGSWLTLKRLSRCHPWGSSGIDPVPKKSHSTPRS
ncbi:MAG: membrane protein insertion efficiency factor YidD [Cryomorphaceae bacterium]|nr:membrane protein insertion efficiency factor YidD [Cryomorphaceae bacterium]